MKYKEKRITLKNGEELMICEAKPEHAGELLAYMDAVGGESGNLSFGAGEFTMTVEQEQEFLKQKNADERGIMFLCRIGGSVVGVAQVSPVGVGKRLAHRGSIAISVRKAHWGKGIGTVVMREMIAFARSAGMEVLELEVCSNNEAAIHLYEKTGFKKIGLYQKFFKYGEKNYADAYIMQAFL